MTPGIQLKFEETAPVSLELSLTNIAKCKEICFGTFAIEEIIIFNNC